MKINMTTMPTTWEPRVFMDLVSKSTLLSSFTVVTQFATSGGTSTGQLTQIKRVYVQGGKVIAANAST
jgi:hypothetical protein